MQSIVIKGARENNLLGINVEIPKGKIVIITGVSGSGKSSLAFDTVYAEAQRRFVESLSSYARQFLEQLPKPQVELIEGLSPAIAIEQKTSYANPRSTVGTITEIYDYLRVLFARLGQPKCLTHDRYVKKQTVQSIVDEILSLEVGTKAQILVPVYKVGVSKLAKILKELRKKGFVRVRINSDIYELEEDIRIQDSEIMNLEVVYDRFVIKGDIQQRVGESVEASLELGNRSFILFCEDQNKKRVEYKFSDRYACPDCGIVFPELEPTLFSFNSPYGACPKCHGLGTVMDILPGLVVPDENLSLKNGAVKPWNLNRRTDAKYRRALKRICQDYGFNYEASWKSAPDNFQKIVLYGEEKLSDNPNRARKRKFEGVIPNIRRRYHQTESSKVRESLGKFMQEQVCPDCKGTRLGEVGRQVFYCGKTIAEVCALSITELIDFLAAKKLSKEELIVAEPLFREITSRLNFLNNTGIGYLTLARTVGTLSGGENQRIRLAGQLGSGLGGVIYVLDEPSIGLHPRDTKRLIDNLKNLRDQGNTVIVVEHDAEIIRAADYIIDIGPGAGINGGQIVAVGTPKEIAKVSASYTGQYLAGDLELYKKSKARQGSGKTITLTGVSQNNLKNINLEIPLAKFVCVTGVSGSGKSSLVNEVLYPYLARQIQGAEKTPLGACNAIQGIEQLDKVIDIDQFPLGRSPRSNPATYTGLFSLVRDVYSKLNEAKVRGYKPGRFSFNVKGGRCEHCQGEGMVKVEMHFLPDVFVPCPECKGSRYNRDTLEVLFKGLNIAEALNLSIVEAREFFRNFPAIVVKLDALSEVGLGYLKLGQSATTLSGGEAQRVKLATELSKRSTGNTFYILDEPTTGLHAWDVGILLNALHKLVDAGNTVLVIEHNLDVIRSADWIIDLGPEGGDQGGYLVVTGTPSTVANDPSSYTGQWLRK